MRSGTVRSLVAVAILGTPLAAMAGRLTTSLMPAVGGDAVMCIATNIGKAPATVAITATNALGVTQAPVYDSCANPLDEGDTCYTLYGANVDVWCAFDVVGKVKASINGMDSGNHVRASLPATK